MLESSWKVLLERSTFSKTCVSAARALSNGTGWTPPAEGVRRSDSAVRCSAVCQELVLAGGKLGRKAPTYPGRVPHTAVISRDVRVAADNVKRWTFR